jgi:hypothetical protein
MSFRQGIFSRRSESVLLTLFCLVEAVWSWTNIALGVRHRVNLITALFSLILSFIFGWIASLPSKWSPGTANHDYETLCLTTGH